MLWGSDTPVLELASTYRAWWAETEAALAGMGQDARAAVLGGTATRVYRL